MKLRSRLKIIIKPFFLISTAIPCDFDNFINYFRSGIKETNNCGIGIEHEKFVFLENSESFKEIKPSKYEHEWSHALVSYDEFICFTHSKNSFFLISLARD